MILELHICNQNVTKDTFAGKGKKYFETNLLKLYDFKKNLLKEILVTSQTNLSH